MNLWKRQQKLTSINQGIRLMGHRLALLNRWQAILIEERIQEVEKVLHRTGQSDLIHRKQKK